MTTEEKMAYLIKENVITLVNIPTEYKERVAEILINKYHIKGE